MPVTADPKAKLLYLMKILLEQSDEFHPLSTKSIIDALSTYDISLERKTLYKDLELLREFGLDIEMVRGKSFGYYIASREFELPELKLLVDAVQSSRFITAKKSNELIKKLSSLSNNHQARQLKRQIYEAERPKAINEEVYYNVDAIHTAINDGYKICFKYFDYSLDKQRIYRKQGEVYSYTPLALCWDDDKYYLICFNTKYQDFIHFRVDRMSNVWVSEEVVEDIDRERFNVYDHINQTFGMFGGPKVRAQLRFDNELINAVLDRFGGDIGIYPLDGQFEITADVIDSPTFLGWMVQFADKAEIVAPESLRAAMKDLVIKIQTKYQ